MILGIYEQEILELISHLSPKTNTFINLGASDGYYAVGSLASNLFNQCYCFESNMKARELIKQTAERNGVTRKLNVNASADAFFYNKIPTHLLNSSTILIDVEGAETEILTDNTLHALSRSNIIVELHPWVEYFDQRMNNIITKSRSTHKIHEIRCSKRDLGAIAEIHALPDNLRWLLCSEGRPCQMSWLHFEPIPKNI